MISTFETHQYLRVQSIAVNFLIVSFTNITHMELLECEYLVYLVS